MPTWEPEFLDFGWKKAAAGYVIRQTAQIYNYLGASDREREDARLFDPGTEVIECKSRIAETYNLDLKNTVHRDFARLPDDRTKLLAFVDQWGLPKAALGPEPLAEVMALRKRLKMILATVDAVNCAKGPRKKALTNKAIVQFAQLCNPVLTLVLFRDKAKASGTVLKMLPLTLFDYMLVQALRELRGKATYRDCLGCGNPFRVGVGGSRRGDAKTCSDTCRKRMNCHKDKEKRNASQG